jgi:CTP synthase
VIAMLDEQERITDKGGTMRLGAQRCRLSAGRAREAYGADEVSERHRHRFELNNAYRKSLEQHGLRCTGINPDRDLVEIVELPGHPWFVGVQYHPEFKSKPTAAHPLFRDFVAATMARAGLDTPRSGTGTGAGRASGAPSGARG